MPGVEATVPVAVVVATRNRAGSLKATLAAVRRAMRPGDELVVVDSASSDAAVADVAHDAGAVLVRCREPGTCRARNAGARAARADVLAFTDDDCLPDPGWVAAVAGAFAGDPALGFMTGRVLARPDGSSSRLSVSVTDDAVPVAVAARAGDGDGTVPVAVAARAGDDDGTVPGHGANMAWRRCALETVGGFDETLGPGAPLRAAEDQDAFRRALLAGYGGRYEPAAVVHHRQWRTTGRQLVAFYRYGVGRGALWVKRWRPRVGGRHPALRSVPALLRDPRGRRALRRLLWDDGTVAVVGRLRQGYELGALAEAAGLVGALWGVVRAWTVPVVDGHFVARPRGEPRRPPRR